MIWWFIFLSSVALNFIILFIDYIKKYVFLHSHQDKVIYTLLAGCEALTWTEVTEKI